MTNHTPAPWRPVLGSLVRVFAGDKVVCGVHKIGRHSTDRLDEGTIEANARLIAAAPDLLAACEEMLPLLERALALVPPLPSPHPAIDMPDDKIGRMRAAVAKARGKIIS